ncbi:unnamed protein product [Ectocarpus sp. CCAP 1310/34]|nr:unnamed protein product [Ectocarpus sp. CCAP 1310/34]
MAFFNDQQKEETTDDEVQAEYVAGDQRLALMRSFETRLWELDVQVQGIKCIGFGQGQAAPPSEVIQRCSDVGVSVAQENPGGFAALSPWPVSCPLLLAESVGSHFLRLYLVTADGGHEVRSLLFLSPITTHDFDTLIHFMLGMRQWCG